MKKYLGVILVLSLILSSGLAYAACRETDGGDVPNVKGTLYANWWIFHSEKTDYCEKNVLTEFYCSGDKATANQYKCDYGCKDGACITPKQTEQPKEIVTPRERTSDSNQEPVINIIFPTGGETVSGTITVEAEIYDLDGTLNNVHLRYVNSSGQVTFLTSTNTDTNDIWYASWDTTTIPNGIYRIYISALDNDGAWSSVYSGNFTVQNNWQPCVDSDYGKDFYTPGQVTLNYNNPPTTWEDICQKDYLSNPALINILEEQFCNGGITTNHHTCPNGCDNAACIICEPVFESSPGAVLVAGIFNYTRSTGEQSDNLFYYLENGHNGESFRATDIVTASGISIHSVHGAELKLLNDNKIQLSGFFNSNAVENAIINGEEVKIFFNTASAYTRNGWFRAVNLCTPSCTDPDNSEDYSTYAPGNWTGGPDQYTPVTTTWTGYPDAPDTCVSGNTFVSGCPATDSNCRVEEHFCYSGGRGGHYIDCENGCANGACLLEPTCIDSDDLDREFPYPGNDNSYGYNIYQMGHFEYGGDDSGWDGCGPDGALMEWYCDNTNPWPPQYEHYFCPEGYICDEGACVEESSCAGPVQFDVEVFETGNSDEPYAWAWTIHGLSNCQGREFRLYARDSPLDAPTGGSGTIGADGTGFSDTEDITEGYWDICAYVDLNNNGDDTEAGELDCKEFRVGEDPCAPCNINEVVYEGDEATYTFEGVDYHVEATYIGSSTTKLRVNGILTEELEEGETGAAGNVDVCIKDIIEGTVGGEDPRDVVEFCLNIIQTCTDTDDPNQEFTTSGLPNAYGLNYNIRGTTSGRSEITDQYEIGEDFCSTGSADMLIEYYCGDNSGTIKLARLGHDCPNGCAEGACITNHLRARDVTDLPSNYNPTYSGDGFSGGLTFAKLRATMNSETLVSYSQSSGWVDKNALPQAEIIVIKVADIMTRGAIDIGFDGVPKMNVCVPVARDSNHQFLYIAANGDTYYDYDLTQLAQSCDEIFCTESDAGWDPYQKGTLYWHDGINQQEDQCFNGQILRETNCYAMDTTGPQDKGLVDYTCPNGCVAGACLASKARLRATDVTSLPTNYAPTYSEDGTTGGYSIMADFGVTSEDELRISDKYTLASYSQSAGWQDGVGFSDFKPLKLKIGQDSLVQGIMDIEFEGQQKQICVPDYHVDNGELYIDYAGSTYFDYDLTQLAQDCSGLTCVDSDKNEEFTDGKNILVKGTVTWPFEGEQEEYTDVCYIPDENNQLSEVEQCQGGRGCKVREGWCTNTYHDSFFDCPYGCYDGACLEVRFVDTPCGGEKLQISETDGDQIIVFTPTKAGMTSAWIYLNNGEYLLGRNSFRPLINDDNQGLINIHNQKPYFVVSDHAKQESYIMQFQELDVGDNQLTVKDTRRSDSYMINYTDDNDDSLEPDGNFTIGSLTVDITINDDVNDDAVEYDSPEDIFIRVDMNMNGLGISETNVPILTANGAEVRLFSKSKGHSEDKIVIHDSCGKTDIPLEIDANGHTHIGTYTQGGSGIPITQPTAIPAPQPTTTPAIAMLTGDKEQTQPITPVKAEKSKILSKQMFGKR